MIIEVLFPEICNLYGDLGNVDYLKQSLLNAQKKVEVINTSLKDEPYFNNNKVDLIYMGTTTEKGIELSIKALSPYKDKLKKLIDDGQFILLTGNAIDVFGTYIDSDEASGESFSKECVENLTDSKFKVRLKGLDILKTHSEYHMLRRHNSFYLGEFNSDGDKGIKIVGYKSIFGHTYADDNDGDDTNTEYAQQGWFNTLRGVGRNEGVVNTRGNVETKPELLPEGFKVNHLYATYLLGPLLPLNPLLTKWLLNQLECTDVEPIYYEDAIKAYNDRIADFENTHLNPVY